ncbi:MAG: toxic anion resistance protein [Lachnospiraceae bacterium]|nr:toxic anion resistance protein [Lachnospiraceae bacterium]
MSENTEFNQENTMETFDQAMGGTAAAAAPTLTFEPFKEEQKEDPLQAAASQNITAAARDLDESNLTPEERKMVDEFSKQIDVTNSTQIMQYGAGAQAKVASFSETALEKVQNKDLGEIGDMISSVVTELKGFDVEKESKGVFGFFKKQANKASTLKEKYSKVSGSIDRITESLENHQVTLMKDVATLDQLYELNKNYYKELSMYIIAGKKKLSHIEQVEIPELEKKARESGSQEDAQAVSDLSSMANRFEKKLYDLELTRTISLQMAPQIRLVQNSDVMMSDKIQSTIVNTIPLWKSQMVIALGVQHSAEAAKAQKEVSELTNAMLKENAEKLKTASIEVAQESERGVVDIETLAATNNELISTLDEVLRIQTEGREKRRTAEAELEKIEADLKNKLLNMRSSVS